VELGPKIMKIMVGHKCERGMVWGSVGGEGKEKGVNRMQVQYT
jgi:hypothetical protein